MSTAPDPWHDAKRIAELEAQVRTLTQHLGWFKRQLFGHKSKRRVVEDSPSDSGRPE